MSAVEALAEVLVPHSFNARYTVNTDGSWTWKCSCGHEYAYGVEIADQEIQHRAEALVAAIRSMPAEQVAELIDGEMERGSAAFDATASGNYEATGAHAIRAVGPWCHEPRLPLGVSPETNGEQK